MRPLIFLLFIILAGCTVLHLRQSPLDTSACPKLTCITMDGISDFRMKEIYSSTPQIYRALYSFGTRLLRIEARRVPAASSAQELDASITRVKAMFENAPAPYPGELSDTIVCDEKFVPTYEVINGQKSRLNMFTGYLNNRLTFGSCTQNQAVYKGSLIFTYCPDATLLVRLELIAPSQEFEQHEAEIMRQLKTLSCVNNNYREKISSGLP